MKLHTEHISKNSRYWQAVNKLAKEDFPPEEYLAPPKRCLTWRKRTVWIFWL